MLLFSLSTKVSVLCFYSNSSKGVFFTLFESLICELFMAACFELAVRCAGELLHGTRAGL